MKQFQTIILLITILITVSACGLNNDTNGTNQDSMMATDTFEPDAINDEQISEEEWQEEEILLAPDESNQWDEELGYGDDYIVVRKDEETYNDYVINVGIVDTNGNWLVPLSDDFIFAQAIQKIYSKHGNNTKFVLNYMGEGVFILSRHFSMVYSFGRTGMSSDEYYSEGGAYENDCYLYNVISGKSSTFTAKDISFCENGYMLMYPSTRYNSNFCKISADGEVTEIPVEYSSWYDGPEFSGLANGQFFANGCFYDIDGNLKIDLSQYQLTRIPGYLDGIYEIEFKNSVGTEWEASVDQSGNFVEEPRKIS